MASVHGNAGDPCTGEDDTCGDDATLCCGIATMGFVMNGESVTTIPVPNLAVCNVAPVDGVSQAVDTVGTMTGDDASKTVISYGFDKAGFECLKDPVPPTPTPPTPAPPLPTSGVGSPCTGAADTCGDDTSLCCGIAMNGQVVGADPTVPTGVTLPNAAICNNAPIDKVAKAIDFTGMLEGAGTDVAQISFLYAKADFECFNTPTPPAPGPEPPKPDDPTDKNVGTPCKSADDKCGNADDKTDYCCGVATGGKVLDVTGKTPTAIDGPNILICNGNPDGDKKPVDYTSYAIYDTNVVTILYPAGKFTCMSSAKALIASATALIAAAIMM